MVLFIKTMGGLWRFRWEALTKWCVIISFRPPFICTDLSDWKKTILFVQRRKGLWLPWNISLIPHTSQAHDDSRKWADVGKISSSVCDINLQFLCFALPILKWWCQSTEASGKHFGKWYQSWLLANCWPNAWLCSSPKFSVFSQCISKDSLITGKRNGFWLTSAEKEITKRYEITQGRDG